LGSVARLTCSTRRGGRSVRGMPGQRRRESLLRCSVAMAALVGTGLGVGALSLACTPSSATTPPASDERASVNPEARGPEISDKDVPAVLIRGARVFTGAGVSYDAADVLLERGKVSAVGPKLEAPKGATIVDAKGKTVTP